MAEQRSSSSAPDLNRKGTSLVSETQAPSAPVAPGERPPAAPPESRAQLRRLVRGDLRQLSPLIRKALEAAAARRQLRRVNHLGKNARVRGRVIVRNKGRMHIGERVRFFAATVPTELVAYTGGELTIGPRTFVNYGCSFVVSKRITIGADCLFGPHITVTDNDFHELHDRSRQPEPQPVTIGDHAWIAMRAIILPGVTIGDGAVIGAGSVVTKDVPPNGVVAGNPARLLRILGGGQLDPTPSE
jgi:maltose O-acetyltransferase